MNFRATGTLLLLGTATCAFGYELPVDASAIERLILRDGAEKVREQSWDHPLAAQTHWYRIIIPGIESGSSEWIHVWSMLVDGADGEGAESLEDAIYEALPKNPYRVLPLIMRHNEATAEEACNFSAWPSEPKGGLRKYLAGLERALYKPRSKYFQSLRSGCLVGIAMSRGEPQPSGQQ